MNVWDWMTWLAVGLNALAVVLLGGLLILHIIDRRPDLFDTEDGKPNELEDDR